MRLRRLAAAGLVVSALWTVPHASAAGDPYDPASTGAPDVFPPPDEGDLCVSKPIGTLPPGFVAPSGLPDKTGCTRVKSNQGAVLPGTSTNYAGVSTVGIQGAPHLGQWIKIPPSISVAVVPIHLNNYKPDLAAEPPGTTTLYTFYPSVWFVSQDRQRVGEMPPFTVKSLAFGAIPVEVTVHITQPKRADGTIEPIKVVQSNPQSFTGVGVGTGGLPNTQLARTARGSGRVQVRLSDATVDGVPLQLGAGCRTSTFGTLTVIGDGYLYNSMDQRLPVPAGKYNGARGGTLHGTIDIPSFTGCVSPTGDDVSPLLTNLVSGAGNPITFNQTAAQPTCYPQYNVAACQTGLVDVPYPTDLPKPDAASVRRARAAS